jgi:cation diffusion facilitator CzcD-associated flavoprotein CzcO
VARQYIESYFSLHGLDSLLSLNTTVEDLSAVPAHSDVEANGKEKWKLTLRKYDLSRHLDTWWEEFFDAVVIANGHYSVPYVSDPDLLCWHHILIFFRRSLTFRALEMITALRHLK